MFSQSINFLNILLLNYFLKLACKMMDFFMPLMKICQYTPFLDFGPPSLSSIFLSLIPQITPFSFYVAAYSIALSPPFFLRYHLHLSCFPFSFYHHAHTHIKLNQDSTYERIYAIFVFQSLVIFAQPNVRFHPSSGNSIILFC